MSDTVHAQSPEPQPLKLREFRVYPFTEADDLIDFAESRKGLLVAVNAEKMGRANRTVVEIINSNIGYCDGVGPVMAARQKGARVNKIAGCELWLHIIERYHSSKTFYIIGATEEVHRATIEKLRRQYPDIKIVGHRNGYIGTEAERAAVIDDVVVKRPDVVFVAMGSPVQEILMEEMNRRHRAIYQGLGGSFDVYTGAVTRAPRWWRDHNLEFAYRFVTQPAKRLRRDVVYLKFAWWLLWRNF